MKPHMEERDNRNARFYQDECLRKIVHRDFTIDCLEHSLSNCRRLNRIYNQVFFSQFFQVYFSNIIFKSTFSTNSSD